MSKINVTYEIEDGYCGKSRPQRMTVDSEDFAGMDEQQVKDYLEELVHDDMLQLVDTNYNPSDFVPEILEAIKKDEEDG